MRTTGTRLHVGAALLLFLSTLSAGALVGDAPPAGKTSAEHAVFLLDTSQSRTPERFTADLKQLRKVLESDAAIKHFNVLLFDVSARWIEPKSWLDNSADRRADVLKRLEGVMPEGATDFAAALDKLIHPGFEVARGTPLSVYVLSDGQITWGEDRTDVLVGRFRSRCPYPTRFKCFAVEDGKENLKLFGALESATAAEGSAKQDWSPRADFQRFLSEIEPQAKIKQGKDVEQLNVLLKMLGDEDFEAPAIPEPAAVAETVPVSAEYRQKRDANRKNVPTYLAEADRRQGLKDMAGAVRVLSSAVEEHPTNGEVLRLVGYRLLDLKQPAQAVRLFRRVQRLRPFEAHSHRDLARSLEDAGKYGLAALQYEIVQAGTWNAKYTTSLKEVVLEEYAHMMRDAVRRKLVGNKLMNQFGERLEGVDASKLQADLRVTISWNTDDTDVDLWVIEPDGTKCYYAHQKTKNGGELTQDVTQGYGPERYQMIKAGPGEYTIKVHYFSGPRNPLIGETHVNVVVRRNAGTPQEVSQRYTVILRQRNDLVEVCRMKY